MGFLGWNIGVSQQFCIDHNQTVTCPYPHGDPFRDFQRIKPNYDIVTKEWWGAFLTTAWATSVVSLILLMLESYLHFKKPRVVDSEAKPTHDWAARAMRVMEGLINGFSEQQTITSLSLVVVAGHNGCEITAYEYNLICFYIVMSLITHLNALTNTQNWLADPHHTRWRGIANGIVKIVPIFATVILAGLMLGARIGVRFPTSNTRAATFKAVCYENTDRFAGADAFGASDWANNGFVQYMILVIDLFVVGGIFTLALLKKIKQKVQGKRALVSIILRILSTSATTGTLIWLSIEYIHMRRSMENDDFLYHKPEGTKQYSYFNVVQWALFASSVYNLFGALADAYKIQGVDTTTITDQEMLDRVHEGANYRVVDNFKQAEHKVSDLDFNLGM